MADPASAALRGGPQSQPQLPPAPDAWVRPIAEPPLVRRLRPAVARRLLALAIGLGVLFQALAVGQLAGINAFAWTAAALAAAVLVAPRPWRMDRADAWLPVAALVFAGLVAMRANAALIAFDLLATLTLLGASCAAFAGAAVTRRSLAGVAVLVGQVLALTGAGSTRLSAAPRGLRGPSGVLARSHGPAILVGLALALPLVLVFGILFVSADAVFASLVGGLLEVHLELGDLPGRAFVALTAAWLVGGLLVLTVAATRKVRHEPRIGGITLGPVEATVALVAVDLVFGAFVLVQAGYLFGGMDTLATTGLGYAQYARRGFFELVAVAVLAGGVVLALESVVADRRWAYRSAALALVGLTGVVLLSAAVRMGLYQDAFGWSELRFFVVAAIVWLALCLVAAAVTIAAGRSRALPAAVAALGLIVAVGVNLADPGAFIAERNLDRAAHPASIPPGGTSGLDTDYLASLGPDAIPAMVRALPTLPPTEAAAVAATLAAQRDELEAALAGTGWPSWNRSRAVATELLAGAPGT